MEQRRGQCALPGQGAKQPLMRRVIGCAYKLRETTGE